MKQPKIALIHDYLNQYGGAERVVEVLHEIWPNAPVYVGVYEKNLMEKFGFDPNGWDIKTTFMQKLPLRYTLSKHYFFLYPLAFSSLDLKGFDVIVSSSSYAAKFVKKPTGAIHICYLHTPPRFLWGYDTELTRYYAKPFDKYLSPIYQVLVPPIKGVLKNSDYKVAQKVDYFIANSEEVKRRIKKHYGRDSIVINPPVDVDRFAKQTTDHRQRTTVSDGFFLVVSRLGGYKRIDIAVEAFNKIGLPLKIIGVGPQLEYLKKTGKRNIEFLGRVSDEEMITYLQNSLALIFPTHEDFGIMPVEAMAAGRGVLAYRGGGVLESLLPGRTGEFFYPQTTEALIEAIKNFDPKKYKREDCVKQAKKFDKEVFRKKMKEFVAEVYKKETSQAELQP